LVFLVEENQWIFNTKKNIGFSGFENQWIFNTKKNIGFSGFENQWIFNMFIAIK